MHLKKWLAMGLMAAAMAGTAKAALIDRGGGLIFDTTRNITWLQNMNVNGLMTWDGAMTWANDLVYGGFGDWRLPTLNPADVSCSPASVLPLWAAFTSNCTGGELTGLFVGDLGNKATESVRIQAGDTLDQIANLALFTNIQSMLYWSSTVFATNPDDVWFFNTDNGAQASGSKVRGGGLLQEYYAVAVRDGDVAASVPEPQTLALLSLSFGALAMGHRRRLRSV